MSERLVHELNAVLKAPLAYSEKPFPGVIESQDKASVLVLFRGPHFLASEILLILRSPELLRNPGQVAFPGGRIEPSDLGNSLRTALRETEEEVGLSSNNILGLGLLPALPTVTGQLLVDPVLGVWNTEISEDFILQSSEVIHAEWVSVSSLISSRVLEQRLVHSVEMELPVFKWGERQIWGMTAMIFDLILKRYDSIF